MCVKWYLKFFAGVDVEQNSNWNYFKQKKSKLNKNIVRFSRRDWWAVLLCIGSHSKLWLNCVIIVSLKFGSAVAAAFLHFTNAYRHSYVCARTATRTFTYVVTASDCVRMLRHVWGRCVYVFVQQFEIHQPTSQHTHTCMHARTHTRTHVRGQRAPSTLCGSGIASTRTHLLFTHCHAFARTHST